MLSGWAQGGMDCHRRWPQPMHPCGRPSEQRLVSHTPAMECCRPCRCAVLAISLFALYSWGWYL